MTYICPTSGMPRKGSLPDGVSEESLRDAPNLATALKQVQGQVLMDYLHVADGPAHIHATNVHY